MLLAIVLGLCCLPCHHTETIPPQVEHIVSLVVFLVHETCEESGAIFKCWCGILTMFPTKLLFLSSFLFPPYFFFFARGVTNGLVPSHQRSFCVLHMHVMRVHGSVSGASLPVAPLLPFEVGLRVFLLAVGAVSSPCPHHSFPDFDH